MLPVHGAPACGTLRSQMGMLDEILKALEANIVSIATLSRFVDEVQANGAAEFQKKSAVNHPVLQRRQHIDELLAHFLLLLTASFCDIGHTCSQSNQIPAKTKQQGGQQRPKTRTAIGGFRAAERARKRSQANAPEEHGALRILAPRTASYSSETQN